MSSRDRSNTCALPEVPLATGTILIADVHLDLATPGATRGFENWVATIGGAPALWILGDLFDVWVGPAQATLPSAAPVLDALRALARAGTRVCVVCGNRDFLLDRSFEERTGARVYREGAIGVCPSGAESAVEAQRLALIHGDTLCTLDTGYQRLRRVLRSRAVSLLVPRLPLSAGAWAARRLRRASVRALDQKLPEEKSMQSSSCIELARVSRVQAVVCGHAHCFSDRQLAHGLRWIVLDAFGGAHDLLRIDAVQGIVLSATNAHELARGSV